MLSSALVKYSVYSILFIVFLVLFLPKLVYAQQGLYSSVATQGDYRLSITNPNTQPKIPLSGDLTIEGTVEKSNEPVANATISIKIKQSEDFQTKTGDDGKFKYSKKLDAVGIDDVGSYTISVTALEGNTRVVGPVNIPISASAKEIDNEEEIAEPDGSETSSEGSSSTSSSGSSSTTGTGGVSANAENFGPWQFAPWSDMTRMGGGFCFIAGQNWVAPDKPCPGIVMDPATGTTKLALYDRLPEGGALGGVSNMMLAMYSSPPTSSGYYLANLGSNLGLVDEAYAQTIGGSGDLVLNPVLKLWQVFRNLAYLSFILVFMAVGVMIMFRKKINPQTVISIQAALPGLVIGLILVTFSYFLAALIVDLSFVGMRLVAYIFQSANLPNIIQDGVNSPVSPSAISNTADLGTNGNVFSLFWAFIINDGLRANVVAPFANALASPGSALFNSTTGTTDLFAIPKFVLGGGAAVLGYVLGGAVGILLSFILIIALFIQMVKLLWALLNSYISILIFTIAGPLLIALGSVPGNGGLITYWWKQLIGNVLVFPAVFFGFLFAGMMLGAGNTDDFTATLPLFAGLPVGVIKALIAYGIVLGIPAIPGMVKEVLGVKDLGAISKEAMTGLGHGVGMGKDAYSAGMKHSGLAEQQAAIKKRDLDDRVGLAGGGVAPGPWREILKRLPGNH